MRTWCLFLRFPFGEGGGAFIGTTADSEKCIGGPEGVYSRGGVY